MEPKLSLLWDKSSVRYECLQIQWFYIFIRFQVFYVTCHLKASISLNLSFFIASQRPLVTFSVTHYCLNCKPANTAVSPRFSPVISQVSCIKVTVDKIVEFSMSLVYCVVQGNDPTQYFFVVTTGHLKGLFLIHAHDESGSHQPRQRHESLR